MTYRLPRTLIVFLALLLAHGVASPTAHGLPGSQLFSLGPPPEPGTPAWWKKYKKKAVFVPHKGYQVEGFDGFYDDLGRPIHKPVAKIIASEKEAGGLLNDVKLSSAVAHVKESVGLGPDEAIAREALSAGEKSFREEDYKGAAKSFEEAVARWPNSQLEQDAMFQLAESHFFGKRYPDAVDAYDALLAKYPNSPHLDKVITREFAVAQYWEKHHQHSPHWPVTPNLLDKGRPLFDTVGRSIKVYENIRLNDPTGPLADDAVMATANSYFLRGRYGDADYHYQLLRTEYPRSEHQYEAHLLGLQCKMRIYKGPDYDGQSLKDAQRLVKQLRVQFADKLNADQRTRLAQISGEVERELAARNFYMAQHFEKIGYNRAARYYYDMVAREHSQSDLGGQSRDKLAALATAPDEPKVPLEGLIDLFPQNSERTSIAQVPLIDRATLPNAPTGVPDAMQQPEIGIATRPGPASDSNDTTYQR